MDGHQQSIGGSPTNPRMVTHQKEVHYRLGIWQLNFTDKKTPAMDGHLPSLGGLPANHQWSLLTTCFQLVHALFTISS